MLKVNLVQRDNFMWNRTALLDVHFSKTYDNRSAQGRLN